MRPRAWLTNRASPALEHRCCSRWAEDKRFELLRVALNTLSKYVDVRSWQVSAVCELELRPGPVPCGRSRTAANETRTETGAARRP